MEFPEVTSLPAVEDTADDDFPTHIDLPPCSSGKPSSATVRERLKKNRHRLSNPISQKVDMNVLKKKKAAGMLIVRSLEEDFDDDLVFVDEDSEGSAMQNTTESCVCNTPSDESMSSEEHAAISNSIRHDAQFDEEKENDSETDSSSDDENTQKKNRDCYDSRALLDALLDEDAFEDCLELGVARGRYRERFFIRCYDKNGALIKFKPLEDLANSQLEQGNITKRQYDTLMARTRLWKDQQEKEETDTGRNRKRLRTDRYNIERAQRLFKKR